MVWLLLSLSLGTVYENVDEQGGRVFSDRPQGGDKVLELNEINAIGEYPTDLFVAQDNKRTASNRRSNQNAQPQGPTRKEQCAAFKARLAAIQAERRSGYNARRDKQLTASEKDVRRGMGETCR